MLLLLLTTEVKVKLLLSSTAAAATAEELVEHLLVTKVAATAVRVMSLSVSLDALFAVLIVDATFLLV